jgi:hypothetical protein
MGEIWTEATGLPDPKCNADFEKGFQALLDDRKLFISNSDRKSKGATKKLFRRICDLAPTIEDLIYVTESAISSNAGFNYILSAFSGGRDNGKEEEDTPPFPEQGKAKQVQEETKIEKIPTSEPDTTDGLIGNYCFFNRSLRKHPYLKKVPAWVRVMWDNLIMDAAWKDHPVIWEPEEHRKFKVNLKRAQWVVSERQLAKEHKQSPRMIHHWLENLVKQQMIQCDTVFTKGSSKEVFHVAADVAGHVAGHVARGTIVTLLNYNKFQARFEDDVAALVAADVAADVARTKNALKEGKSEDGKIVTQLEKIKITATKIFEIWEKEKGPLEPVRAPRPERLGELVDYLNSLDGKDPVEALTEIIHKARQCHPSHRTFMSPYFFSKDLTHIDQVLNGLYDKSFERGKYGPTRIERAGRGDAEEFGFKGGSLRRVTTLGSSKVPKV